MVGKLILPGAPKRAASRYEQRSEDHRGDGLRGREIRAGTRGTVATGFVPVESGQGIVHRLRSATGGAIDAARVRGISRPEVSRYPQYRGASVQGRCRPGRVDGE